jgi:hypothetical protein
MLGIFLFCDWDFGVAVGEDSRRHRFSSLPPLSNFMARTMLTRWEIDVVPGPNIVKTTRLPGGVDVMVHSASLVVSH